MKDVWPYLTVGLVTTIALPAFAPLWASLVCGLLTLGIAAFFRDPRRDVVLDPRAILSPADGRVVGVADDPPGSPPGTRCVSIFLSIFDVHVNRSPVEGRIADIRYTPGAFLPAFREKASALNEQNLIALENERGGLAFKQIAGVIARRIRCWKKPGDRVAQGEKVGFITFGSRVDLYVPPVARLQVGVGDVVRGGTTVMAFYPDPE